MMFMTVCTTHLYRRASYNRHLPPRSCDFPPGKVPPVAVFPCLPHHTHMFRHRSKLMTHALPSRLMLRQLRKLRRRWITASTRPNTTGHVETSPTAMPNARARVCVWGAVVKLCSFLTVHSTVVNINKTDTEARSRLLLPWKSNKYKVVQIWPGQTVTCLHTNSPGHIWTTLYYMFACVRRRVRACVCPGASACAWACVHVALLIQHATRMRHIVTSFVAPLAPPYFSTLTGRRFRSSWPLRI
jgi:hypothetical protein